MPHLRIRHAAAFLGASDDTVRRLVDAGTLPATVDDAGRRVVDGYDLAMYLRAQASTVQDRSGVASSARNRWVGLVTSIRSDPVMSQVELQCGPFRVVSLMSTEAVHDLGLQLGSVAVAVVKSTNVIVEVAGGSP
jgi:molybdopterin-binding protein